VIILSTVCTRPGAFFSDAARLNVAFTRARHNLVVAGCAHALQQSSPALAALLSKARSTPGGYSPRGVLPSYSAAPPPQQEQQQQQPGAPLQEQEQEQHQQQPGAAQVAEATQPALAPQVLQEQAQQVAEATQSEEPRQQQQQPTGEEEAAAVAPPPQQHPGGCPPALVVVPGEAPEAGAAQAMEEWSEEEDEGLPSFDLL
jgi:ATP-dependent exoDNAse (exonuclease V) beta subunit